MRMNLFFKKNKKKIICDFDFSKDLRVYKDNC